MIDLAILAGLDDRFIDRQSLEVPVHWEVVPHILALRQRALEAGFEMALASGFRDFERQLNIWNSKAEGRRPLLDDAGEPLDAANLGDEALLHAILRWSALPGASRHHWGTDIDVYDAAPCRHGYKLRLTYEETQEGGACAAFHRWLTEELERPECLFFRPYQAWTGGVAPEPWHLSFAPLSADYQESLRPDALRDLIRQREIALRTVILRNFDEVFERYVWVDRQLYPRTAGRGA